MRLTNELPPHWFNQEVTGAVTPWFNLQSTNVRKVIFTQNSSATINIKIRIYMFMSATHY